MKKNILITGASKGIGADCAIHFAKGNNIIIHFNSSEKKAREVANKVENEGGIAFLVQANLMSEEGCLELFNYVKNNFSSLDVLINNAGDLLERQTVEEFTWELMQNTFALNVFSVMKLSSLFVPLLKKADEPSIINISSIAARSGGAPTAIIYAAAKSAIDSLTRGMAKGLAPKIRVNAVAPGVIETNFHERFTSTEQMEIFSQATPLKKNGNGIHVAMAVKMLVGNNFITGETIDVNGGLFMR